MISEFRALNWRSCERTRLFFEQKNLFIGPNGSGKSNLLEALGFLGILRSFRTPKIQELIRQDCTEFHLRCAWDKFLLEVSMNRAGERKLLINGMPERSGRDFIQYFNPVVFAPEDMEIVCGIPTVRRRFFDMLACQLDLGYINVLHDYQKALKMRNTLLKSGKNNRDKLEVYEGLLAFAGADLTSRRCQLIKYFNSTLSQLEEDKNAVLYVDYLQVKPLVSIPSMKECRIKYLKEKDTCLKSEDFTLLKLFHLLKSQVQFIFLGVSKCLKQMALKYLLTCNITCVV